MIPHAVLYDESLPATAKLLYGEIYRLSRANGYCYAKNKDFCQLLDRSASTVGGLLSALATAGYIRIHVIRSNGTSGEVVERRIFIGQKLAPECDEPEDDWCPGKPVEAHQETGGPLPKNRERVSQKTGRPSPGKSVDPLPKNREDTLFLKNNKKKREKKEFLPPSEILEECRKYANGDQELLDAILGLLENRSVRRNPILTMRALHTLTNKLDKLSKGNAAVKIAMLDKATLKNWDSVFELKDDEMPDDRSGPGTVVEEKGVTYI